MLLSCAMVCVAQQNVPQEREGLQSKLVPLLTSSEACMLVMEFYVVFTLSVCVCRLSGDLKDDDLSHFVFIQ